MNEKTQILNLVTGQFISSCFTTQKQNYFLKRSLAFLCLKDIMSKAVDIVCTCELQCGRPSHRGRCNYCGAEIGGERHILLPTNQLHDG